MTSAAILLREAGLRVTDGRVAVLDELERTPHVHAETLFRGLAPRHPRLSVQSVHNVLADLTRVGLVGRIEPASSAALYERRVGDNHHHVVCTSCGSVADVDCLHGSAPCLTPSATNGYVIKAAEVVFWGLCLSCAHIEDLHPSVSNQGEK